MTNIRKERQVINTNFMDIKRTRKENDEKSYFYKFYNLDETY